MLDSPLQRSPVQPMASQHSEDAVHRFSPALTDPSQSRSFPSHENGMEEPVQSLQFHDSEGAGGDAHQRSMNLRAQGEEVQLEDVDDDLELHGAVLEEKSRVLPPTGELDDATQ